MQNQGIRDARKLGTPKLLILGLQHMFAMFGATVLVPALTGLSVSATLLFAGLGTLLFHFLAKGKVPAFLARSFAFIGGYAAVCALFDDTDGMNWIPYAGVGVACSGLLYLILSALVRSFGANRVMRFFPPDRHRSDYHLHRHDAGKLRHQQLHREAGDIALVAIADRSLFSTSGARACCSIIPILLGVVVSYAGTPRCDRPVWTSPRVARGCVDRPPGRV